MKNDDLGDETKPKHVKRSSLCTNVLICDHRNYKETTLWLSQHAYTILIGDKCKGQLLNLGVKH